MKFFPSPVTTDQKKNMSLEDEVKQVLLLQKKVMSEQIQI